MVSSNFAPSMPANAMDSAAPLARSCAVRNSALVRSAPHKDFSDLYEKMSGKGESASEAHRRDDETVQKRGVCCEHEVPYDLQVVVRLADPMAVNSYVVAVDLALLAHRPEVIVVGAAGLTK